MAFTGSTATGRRVYTAAAGNLRPASMELGGKSGESADACVCSGAVQGGPGRHEAAGQGGGRGMSWGASEAAATWWCTLLLAGAC